MQSLLDRMASRTKGPLLARNRVIPTTRLNGKVPSDAEIAT
jgi:hypothetical protein